MQVHQYFKDGGMNNAVGLRMYCADYKKAFGSQAKIPSPKAIVHGALPEAVKVQNSQEEEYETGSDR